MVSLPFTKSKPLNVNTLSEDEANKTSASLVEHVYSQILVSFFSSSICAIILFIGVYDATDNIPLFIWTGIFFSIALVRLILFPYYQKHKTKVTNMNVWINLYTVSCLMGGLSWGLMGYLLFPGADSYQQILMVLMLAGVSAGSVPLSAAIPRAGVAFLIASLFPLIITLIVYSNSAYHFFTFACSFYLAYTIMLTFKIYNLIKNTIILKHQNEILLTNLEISYKALEKTATHDPLTKVANRTLFHVNLDNALKHAQKNNTKVGLFFIDLDGFKIANDTYGHAAGDAILTNVTQRLNSFFRKDDVISRLGGDEFTILIDNLRNRDELITIAKKICELIALPIESNGIILKVTASVGIATYPDNATNSRDLITCADKCMYYAKEHGGNQFHYTN